MLKKLIILILLTISYGYGGNPVNKKCYDKVIKITYDAKYIHKVRRDLEYLTSEQIYIMRTIYQTCLNYDLEYTCLAIGYKESRYGDYMINTLTGDYGLMGINIKTYMDTHKQKLRYYEKIKLISKFIRNDNFNLSASIENLQYWKKTYKSNWKIIWGSYNGGWCPNAEYAKSIMNIIYALKMYFNKHKDIEQFIKSNME